MAIINDPDQLYTGEVTFDHTTYEITLNNGTGNLDDNGVPMGVLYSYAKELWKSDATLIAHPFPFNAIDTDAGKFEVGYNGSEYNDWKFVNDATRKLVRQAGWVEYQEATGDTPVAEFAGITTLGNIDATSKTVGDKAYYYFSSDKAGTRTEFTYAGAVDEAIKIYGDASNGNVNYKSDVLTVAIRQYDKTYGQSTTTEIGKTVKAQLLTFAISESADANVSNNDTTTDAYGVTVTWEVSPVSRNIDGVTPTDFSITINGNNKTRYQIYEAVQSLLRKTTDIDENTGGHIGLVTDQLLRFDGATLVTSQGVFITNLPEADKNDVKFYDDANNLKEYPYSASGIISFNANLVNDGAAEYWMYYTSTFGTASPVQVLDYDDNAITGTVSGSSVEFTYDYDADTDGGGAGNDKSVTVVAIGLNNAQYVLAEGTIFRTKQNGISLVSSLERNYSNT